MIDFAKVEQSVNQLNRQITAGNIDDQTFKAHLVDLIDYAADGHYWMLGHKSKQWYKHDGQQWYLAEPGELRTLSPEVALTPHHNAQQDDILFARQNLSFAWQNVDWPWFITGLGLFSVIGIIIYTAS